jgi:hypothetical protein
MTDEPEQKSPRVVELPRALRFCRHGRDVERVTAGQSLGGWLIWGHYGCDQCERVAFHYMKDRPDEVIVGTQRLPIAGE